MPERAPITPSVLVWARTTAKMSEAEAASKIGVVSDQLISWENGEHMPTMRQAEMLARIYRRPFALFFLPDPPKDFMPLQDFRSSGSSNLSTASVFMIRDIQQKQMWLSEELKSEGGESLPFVGKFSIRSAPDDVAESIRQTLGINVEAYGNNPFLEWVAKAENAGISVSRSSFINSSLLLEKEELQGFAIADPIAPFIFINSQDWPAAQLFTLVHELAHIWIAESGISKDIDIHSERDKMHPVELFCNEVTARALMPETILLRNLEEGEINSESIARWAKRIGVSSFAYSVRLLNAGYLNPDSYQEIKNRTFKEYHAFLELQKQKKVERKENNNTGPGYYRLALNKNGRYFTHNVLESYKSGAIQSNEAGILLSIKANQLQKLEAQLLL